MISMLSFWTDREAVYMDFAEEIAGSQAGACESTKEIIFAEAERSKCALRDRKPILYPNFHAFTLVFMCSLLQNIWGVIGANFLVCSCLDRGAIHHIAISSAGHRLNLF